MDEKEKLANDESQRLEQHEAVKGKVRESVHGEIERDAQEMTRTDRSRAETLARDLKEQAVREVGETEVELAQAKTVARIAQVIDYLFYVLYGLIALQICLELLGAREQSGFKQFLNTITAPMLAPFKGIMSDPAVGSFQLKLTFIIALIVYILLHLAIKGLLRIFVFKKTTV